MVQMDYLSPVPHPTDNFKNNFSSFSLEKLRFILTFLMEIRES